MEENRIGRALLALLVLLVPVALLIFGFVAPAAADQPQPLSDTDKQLLIKVRQAMLWELPAAQQAQQQAGSDSVREAGAKIATQYEQLDKDTRALAKKLGVGLPSQPTEEQQGWLADLTTKWGPEFDTTFANLLRAAHGTVFAAAAEVRAGTRNDAIRAFASQAGDVVKGQMTLLESTGQVNYDSLPEPTLPATSSPNPNKKSVATAHGEQSVVTASAQTSSTGGGVNVGLVIAICLVEFGVLVGVLRLLRTR